jgi:hypothetical protein
MSGFKMGNPMDNVATKNTVRKLSGGKTPSFQGQSLGFQMKNSSGDSGAHYNMASPNKGFFKKMFRGAKKLAGNFVRGKGAFGLLNPLGAIGSRLGLFGKRRGGGAFGGVMGAMGMGRRMSVMRNRMAAMRNRVNQAQAGQIGPPGMSMAGPEQLARQQAVAQATGDLPKNSAVSYKPKMMNPYKNKK